MALATDFASSVQGVRLRITPLQTTGAVQTTPYTLVTDGFIKLSFGLEYTDGDEIEEKNAAGTTCIYWKGADSLKRLNIALTLCSPDPAATVALTGGIVIGTTIIEGYSAPATGALNPLPVALEVWSYANVGGKAVSGSAYWRWMFPWVTLRWDGDREISNGALANDFSGQGLGNAALGTGIADWTWGHLDRPFSYVRTNTLPTVGWTGTPPVPT
jgi:hypothetical protein